MVTILSLKSSLKEPWWNVCTRTFNTAEKPADLYNLGYYEGMAKRVCLAKFLQQAAGA